jgi:Gti1/Pac2 family
MLVSLFVCAFTSILFEILDQLLMIWCIGPPSRVISGIERWTDGLQWGPSRVRDDFLFYQRKNLNDRDTA